MRKAWLSRLTVTALVVVSAVFLAHLGADSHSDDCHACQIAAHVSCVDTASVDLLPPQTALTTVPPVDDAGLPAAMTRGASPRAPPAS
jgi:hypothetical protein